MAINIDKIKEKLEQSENGYKGSNNEESDIWSPKEGKGVHFVRFMPDDDGDPFHELHFHYLSDLGGGTHLCPRGNFGEDCPICEFATEVWNDANGSKQMEDYAKKLFVKQRFYSNVFIRDAEDLELENPVKLLSYPKSIYERLLGFVLDKEIGDFTETGDQFDIKIKKEKGAGDYYATLNVDASRQKSKLASTKKEINQLLEQRLDPLEVFTPSTKEEIQKDLAKISFAEEADTDGVEKYAKSDNDDSSEPTPENIEDAFASLDEG